MLGLVTSKFPELESEADLEARIKEAELYVPKDQLAISPQCGFASTEEGNELTEDDQFAKLALIKRVADRVWGEYFLASEITSLPAPLGRLD